MQTHAWDHFYKIVTIGNSCVGKTSLIKRFVNNIFNDDNLISTIGIDFSIKLLQIDDAKIKLQIWDTAGQERFHSITRSFYLTAKGIIIVYDVTNRKSFEQVHYWLNEISIQREDNIFIPKILVANKTDLIERKVSFEEGLKLAKKNNMTFFETSANTGENVNEMFYAITKCIFNKNNQDKEKNQRDKEKNQQNFALINKIKIPPNNNICC